MKIYELLVGIVLKKNITMKTMPEEMSRAVNMMFLGNEELKKLHKENRVKLYSFSGLAPIEKDRLYKRGGEYLFKIRFLDRELAREFEDLLYDMDNPVFDTLRVTSVSKDIREKINTLYTLNPAVITVEGKSWLKNQDEIAFVKDRILKNANRKYNVLMGSELPVHDFIEKIDIVNRVPMTYSYKKGFIAGNKFMLHIKDDDMSQEIAKIILGAGLLEKNSLSFGFCLMNKEVLV